MNKAKESLIVSIQCVICKEILENEYMICASKGMHRTCIYCYEKEKTSCCVCKTKLTLGYDDLIGQIANVFALERRCKYHAYGCNAIMLQVDYDNHLATCKYITMPCHKQTCDHKFNISMDSMDIHLTHMTEIHNAIRIGYKHNFELIDERNYVMPINNDMFAFIRVNRDKEMDYYMHIAVNSLVYVKLFWINTKHKKESYNVLFGFQQSKATVTKTCHYAASCAINAENTFVEII